MPIPDRSLLVRGPLPPLPHPRVVFSPGSGATFDGDRWYLSLSVTAAAEEDTCRWTYDRRELAAALATVEQQARERTPRAIVLDGRDWLTNPYSARDVERVEATLGRIAEETGAILVVRTWAEITDAAGDRYGAVIDLADGHTWRGEPAVLQRRPGSRSPDTARRRPSSGH